MRVPRAAPSSGNRLLDLLSSIDPAGYSRLLPHLKEQEIARGTTLASDGEAPAHMYFVDSGVASVIAQGSSGECMEVTLVGNEGVTGFVWAASGTAPLFSYVAPVPLHVRRLDAETARLFLQSPQSPLAGLLQSYIGMQMGQVAQSALCARHHTTVQRLARWLLLLSMRLRARVLPFTHEQIGQALGAPRSLVSDAAAELRAHGAITSRRGTIGVAAPGLLQSHACECFQAMRQRFLSYDRLIVRGVGSRKGGPQASRAADMSSRT